MDEEAGPQFILNFDGLYLDCFGDIIRGPN
ncbi:MAG: hypothetical protein QOF24_1802 [Verrucomicrobiota bacterium]